jgi:hypothetical protein
MKTNFHQLILRYIANTIGAKLDDAFVTLENEHAIITHNGVETIFSVNKPHIHQIHITFVNPTEEIQKFIKDGGLKLAYEQVEEDWNLHLAIRDTNLYFNDDFVTNDFIDWQEPKEVSITLDALVFLTLIDDNYELLSYETNINTAKSKYSYAQAGIFYLVMGVENQKYIFQLIIDTDNALELANDAHNYSKISNDILLLTAHINQYYITE